MRTLTFALLGALMGSTVHANLDTEPSIFHKECDKTKDTDTEIQMLFNVYPTQWGLYEVVGCEGVAPTLRISAGKEYKFSQGDRTNWCALPLVPIRRDARAEALPPPPEPRTVHGSPRATVHAGTTRSASHTSPAGRTRSARRKMVPSVSARSSMGTRSSTTWSTMWMGLTLRSEGLRSSSCTGSCYGLTLRTRRT